MKIWTNLLHACSEPKTVHFPLQIGVAENGFQTLPTVVRQDDPNIFGMRCLDYAEPAVR